MSNDYEYNYEHDDMYCWPNSSVLKNRLNITDNDELSKAESFLSALAINEMQEKPIKGNFNLKHLQDIHKYIFKDIYYFAGEIRTVNIAKNDLFCLVQNISIYANGIFEDLRKDNYLIKMDTKNVINKLAYYLGEINGLHPFREGNGRTQRVFIEMLAKVAGYNIDFSQITKEQMIEASVKSLRGNNIFFEKMFTEIISRISREEQKQFIESIAIKDSRVLKAYKEKSKASRNKGENDIEL